MEMDQKADLVNPGLIREKTETSIEILVATTEKNFADFFFGLYNFNIRCCRLDAYAFQG